MRINTLGWLSTAAIGLAASAAQASIPFKTSETSRYAVIGTGPENLFQGKPGVGAAVSISGYELGANKAPVPSTGDFLSNGSSGGPSLLFNVPSIPLAARLVESGITGDGNIAVTNPIGVFILANTGIYGDLGIHTAQPAQAADVGVSDSFYNDTNHFPNTFTSTGLTNPGVNNNTGGFGEFVPAAAANPAASIEKPTAAGVTGNTNFAGLTAELEAARQAIIGLPATQILSVPSGVLAVDTTVLLSPGLNVIDVVTSPNDFVLDTMNLVVDGPAGSSAIFRIASDVKMSVSNANILVGDGGIGLRSVMFFSNRPDNATHFQISNSVLNGVAFWSLRGLGAEISVNAAQGCAQFVADKVTISDSRLAGCAFSTACPGDINGDFVVDQSDLGILLGNFGTPSGATPEQGDLDGDGDVDQSDLGALLAVFGTSCK